MTTQKKPKYSVAATRFWTMFKEFDGWDFGEIHRRAEECVGKKFVRFMCRNNQSPVWDAVTVAGVREIKLAGDTYTGRDGVLSPRIVFECIPEGHPDWRVEHDAAWLYETKELALKEAMHNNVLVATEFEGLVENIQYHYNCVKRELEQFAKWEGFFAAHGIETPLEEGKRNSIAVIRKTVEGVKRANLTKQVN